MKKILFSLTLIMTTVCVLSGCETNQTIETNQPPRIRGKSDFSFDKEDRTIWVQDYDFLNTVYAKDEEDGDITDRITYKVYDYYTNEQVFSIDLSVDRKYIIVYSVTDSNQATDTAQAFIIVGDPNNSLTDSGEQKPNITDYDYEQVKETYQEIFFQDFNYEGLPGSDENESDYNAYVYQTGGGGWGNQEVQIYNGANLETCRVENGNLVITVVKKNNTFYSARLNTSNNFSKDWTYGRFEVRAKLPTEKGTWPAIWMMPNNYTGWPYCGEIDIMETSQLYSGRIIGTIHTAAFNWPKNNQKTGSWYGDISEYHTYALEWLPDRLKFYVDDTNYFNFIPGNYVTTITRNEWPFDNAFHFIFNIAMGGNMGGSFDASAFNPDGDVSMYIDSIRVLQSTYINDHFH